MRRQLAVRTGKPYVRPPAFVRTIPFINSPRFARWSLALVLLGAVAWVYLPAASAGYVWDDNDYVSDNRNLDTLDGLQRIWMSPRASPQYYPLVFTSFWVERQVFGTGAAAHHVVNACLHAFNAFLLWVLLRRLQVPGAYVAALVFAVHPVHVESVAWITQRKNVLSGLFYLSALWACLEFRQLGDRNPAEGGNRERVGWYIASLLLFGAALASKTVTATLPAVLLLVQWWKGGTLRARDWQLVLPFAGLGVLAGAGTAWLEVHHVGAAGDEWTLGLGGRILLAARVPWFYAAKLVWPAPLMFVYPRWQVSADAIHLLYLAATTGLVAALWACRKRVGTGPFVAIVFFLITLFPAMGFFNVYPMRYSYVADHFQYLASIGAIALLVGSGGWILRRAAGERAAIVVALVVVAAFAARARAETGKYEGLEALWLDTLAKNPGAWMAHNNMGTLRLRQQRWAEAEKHFEAALRVKADTPEANNNLGTALYAQGKIVAAAEQYRAATAVDPGNAGALNNLGIALAASGRYEEAIDAYRSSLALSPVDAAVHYNLGKAYYRTNDLDQAERHYTEAIRLDPGLAMAHYELGLVMQAQGDIGALAHLHTALELMPGFAEGHVHLGNTRLKQGLAAEAIRSYTAAIAAKPEYAEAHCNRATAYLLLGQLPEAQRDYSEALRLRPNYEAAEAGLASALAQVRRAGKQNGPVER